MVQQDNRKMKRLVPSHFVLQAAVTTILILFYLLFSEISSASAASLQPSVSFNGVQADLAALLDFRAAADTDDRLVSWNGSSPCGSWRGVACAGGRVTRLVLENLSLAGPAGLSILTSLDQLRVLSLKWNRLSGPIPPELSRLSTLKLLFLSHNAFSGHIPPSVASVHRLYRLDLGANNLTGQVPVEFNRLSHLLTLRLDSNRLSGPVPRLSLPRLQDLNLSSNFLSGAVPPSLAGFPAGAFAGNPALCGAPLSTCRGVVSEPISPAANASKAAPVPPASAVIASSPSSKPEVVAAHGVSSQTVASGRGRGMSRLAVIAIIVGDFAVLVLVSGILFCYFWRKFARKNPSRLREGEKIVYSSSPYTINGGGLAGVGGGFERGKMVFIEGANRFELEDLLRASAEMLGKGAYGTAYRAVLDDGNVMAVKRLREVQVSGRREFEGHMEMLGRLEHPNVVPLKAYYFAPDEKLLVYEYMPNGSVFSLLHGNRGPGRTPLDWTARMRIAVGAARGLAFIHQSSRSPKLAHGNVKSTNILVDKDGSARLADAGLALLGPAAAAVGRSGGYRAPEAPADGRRPWGSLKADVYAFGVVLLELLTGKPATDVSGGMLPCPAVDLPRWVQSVVREEWTAEVFDLELMRYKGIEEEMVAMLQIALACTAVAPDQRPKMANVAKMIEEICGGAVVEQSPSHDSFGSVSDSPTLSEDTAAAAWAVTSDGS